MNPLPRLLLKSPGFLIYFYFLLLALTIFGHIDFILRTDKNIVAQMDTNHAYNAQTLDKNQLPLAQWFGNATPSATVTLAAEYALKGIFMSQNPSASYVAIAEKGKAEKLYRLNDRLPDDALIVGIFSDYIVLQKHQGEKYNLSLNTR